MRIWALLVVAACSSKSATTVDAPATPADVAVDAPFVPPPPPPPATVMQCATLTPLGSGTCAVTAGSATRVIEGDVLTPTTVFIGGQVAIGGDGKISCVGCACAQGGETIISCPNAAISPGLINTHEHITFAQNQPATATTLRYEDRQQWRKGLDGKPKIPDPGSATNAQIAWGELRMLVGGATSIVGSGGIAGLLRNLDESANEGGLGKPAVFFDTFPLDDSGGTRRTGDCNYGGNPDTANQVSTDLSFEPHTAEGIDATARNEFLCESSASFDVTTPGLSNNLVLPKTSMIHAVGLETADYNLMAAHGTSLIWSPRSNISLYGDTARVTIAARFGVNIALGTDWIISGSMSLLRELACADSFNKTQLGGFFTDQQLWAMVTSNAALVTHMDDVIGTLATGHVADISVFAGNGQPNAFRSVLVAEPKDVALVMRGGVALYGDATVVSKLATSCDDLPVCGVDKQVCTSTELGETYAALKTAVGATIYDAGNPFACGVPANEPTCVPSRPTAVAGSTVYTGVPTAADTDGDGIPDATDLCPTVFDPVRPLDGGHQVDTDGDGLGDACDPCPFDANTTTCT
jgi:large repetitive protein